MDLTSDARPTAKLAGAKRALPPCTTAAQTCALQRKKDVLANGGDVTPQMIFSMHAACINGDNTVPQDEDTTVRKVWLNSISLKSPLVPSSPMQATNVFMVTHANLTQKLGPRGNGLAGLLGFFDVDGDGNFLVERMEHPLTLLPLTESPLDQERNLRALPICSGLRHKRDQNVKKQTRLQMDAVETKYGDRVEIESFDDDDHGIGYKMNLLVQFDENLKNFIASQLRDAVLGEADVLDDPDRWLMCKEFFEYHEQRVTINYEQLPDIHLHAIMIIDPQGPASLPNIQSNLRRINCDCKSFRKYNTVHADSIMSGDHKTHDQRCKGREQRCFSHTLWSGCYCLEAGVLTLVNNQTWMNKRRDDSTELKNLIYYDEASKKKDSEVKTNTQTSCGVNVRVDVIDGVQLQIEASREMPMFNGTRGQNIHTLALRMLEGTRYHRLFDVDCKTILAGFLGRNLLANKPIKNKNAAGVAKTSAINSFGATKDARETAAAAAAEAVRQSLREYFIPMLLESLTDEHFKYVKDIFDANKANCARETNKEVRVLQHMVACSPYGDHGVFACAPMPYQLEVEALANKMAHHYQSQFEGKHFPIAKHIDLKANQNIILTGAPNKGKSHIVRVFQGHPVLKIFSQSLSGKPDDNFFLARVEEHHYKLFFDDATSDVLGKWPGLNTLCDSSTEREIRKPQNQGPNIMAMKARSVSITTNGEYEHWLTASATASHVRDTTNEENAHESISHEARNTIETADANNAEAVVAQRGWHEEDMLSNKRQRLENDVQTEYRTIERNHARPCSGASPFGARFSPLRHMNFSESHIIPYGRCELQDYSVQGNNLIAAAAFTAFFPFVTDYDSCRDFIRENWPGYHTMDSRNFLDARILEAVRNAEPIPSVKGTNQRATRRKSRGAAQERRRSVGQGSDASTDDDANLDIELLRADSDDDGGAGGEDWLHEEDDAPAPDAANHHQISDDDDFPMSEDHDQHEINGNVPAQEPDESDSRRVPSEKRLVGPFVTMDWETVGLRNHATKANAPLQFALCARCPESGDEMHETRLMESVAVKDIPESAYYKGHAIRYAQVKDHSIEEATDAFVRFISRCRGGDESKTLYVLVQNLEGQSLVDVRAMTRMFQESRRTIPANLVFVDIKKLDDQRFNDKTLQDIAQIVGLEFDDKNAHDAYYDAERAYKALEIAFEARELQQLCEKYDEETSRYGKKRIVHPSGDPFIRCAWINESLCLKCNENHPRSDRCNATGMLNDNEIRCSRCHGLDCQGVRAMKRAYELYATEEPMDFGCGVRTHNIRKKTLLDIRCLQIKYAPRQFGLSFGFGTPCVDAVLCDTDMTHIKDDLRSEKLKDITCARCKWKSQRFMDSTPERRNELVRKYNCARFFNNNTGHYAMNCPFKETDFYEHARTRHSGLFASAVKLLKDRNNAGSITENMKHVWRFIYAANKATKDLKIRVTLVPMQ